MCAKSVVKLWVIFGSGLIIAFLLSPLSLKAQVLYLQAGTTTTVNSGQATCVHAVDAPDPAKGTGAAMDSGCDGARLMMNLSSGNTALPRTVNLSATSQLVVQFQVDTQSGAPDVSLLPVQIAVPVVWKGVLLNDDIVPPDDPLKSVGAYTDVNGSLELVKGRAGVPETRGAEVSANHFMGAYHAGITGCLSVPKTKVKAAIMAAKCVAAVYKKEEGDGTIYLSGLIKTGQTYDVVLDLQGDVYTFNEGSTEGAGHPTLNFEVNLLGKNDPSFGLTWTHPMTISIGTDFQSRIQGFQNQIDQLRSQLMQLRHDFDVHTHVYLTGKGVGQNNTRVTTGRPVY